MFFIFSQIYTYKNIIGNFFSYFNIFWGCALCKTGPTLYYICPFPGLILLFDLCICSLGKPWMHPCLDIGEVFLLSWFVAFSCVLPTNSFAFLCPPVHPLWHHSNGSLLVASCHLCTLFWILELPHVTDVFEKHWEHLRVFQQGFDWPPMPFEASLKLLSFLLVHLEPKQEMVHGLIVSAACWACWGASLAHFR